MDFEIVLSSNDSRFVENFGDVVSFSVLPAKTKAKINAGVVIIYIALLLMLETLGNFLLVSMIVYEKYGMDPQKRTIANQLLTRMLIVQIFFNIFIMPLSLFTVFGLHSKYFAIIKKVQAFQKDFTKYSNLNFANYRVSQVKLDKTKKLF